MSKKLGHFAKLYIGAAGSTAATEVKLVTTVTITGTAEAVDATDRNCDGYASYVAGLKNITFEATLNWDNSVATLDMIRTAYIQQTPIAAFPSDGNGGGFDGDFIVTQFKENQPNNNVITYDISLQVNADTRKPVFTSPASSGTTGTAIPTTASSSSD